jgi:hypothetical protein
VDVKANGKQLLNAAFRRYLERNQMLKKTKEFADDEEVEEE